jgi:hypothetical protein
MAAQVQLPLTCYGCRGAGPRMCERPAPKAAAQPRFAYQEADSNSMPCGSSTAPLSATRLMCPVHGFSAPR